VSAAVQTLIGTCTAADTCHHDNMHWSVQIADLNISIFAQFSDRRSEGIIFFVQDSQIGDINVSPCIIFFRSWNVLCFFQVCCGLLNLIIVDVLFYKMDKTHHACGESYWSV